MRSRLLRTGPRRGLAAALLAFVVVSVVLVATRVVRDSEDRMPADCATEEHACRFWALVGSGYPDTLITDHLRDGMLGTAENSLKFLGQFNYDGWGIASFLRDELEVPLNRPLIRRGGPSSYDPNDPDYDLAVDELDALEPQAVLAHVRLGSSGHSGIPDPHPFQHEGIVFAHNGTIPESLLEDLLTADEEDFFEKHPPDYKEGYVGTGYIDSELYFLFLLKYERDHPSLSRIEALQGAIGQLAQQAYGRLNFVMTAGDTLFALRHANNDAWDPVRYAPALASAPAEASPYWVVASQAFGSGDLTWTEIPAKSLGVFVPGEQPAFYEIEQGSGPEFWLDAITVETVIDGDGDGWASRFRVCCDPNVEFGSYCVSLRLVAYMDDAEHAAEGPTRCRWITEDLVDEHCIEMPVVPDDLPPSTWDVHVELYDQAQPGDPVAVATPETHPFSGLGGIQVEGSTSDEASGPNPAVGAPQPNPGHGSLSIPVRVPPGGAKTGLEVWDSSGRLIWKDENGWTAGGEQELYWDGYDLSRARASAGAYFCRVRIGEEAWERRFTLLR